VQGGARAGKTIAILIILCDLSFEVKDKIISIVTDSYPNLEKGAMRDWEKLIKATGRERYFKVNLAKHTWTNLCTNTVLEFFSCDSDDALGAGRDYLFINEASRINYKTYDQLALRTTGDIWIDFNPTHEFWVHTELLTRPKGVSFIKVTYRDNEAIPEPVLEELLAHKGDGTNNWWRVYGEGEIGSLEGNVYEGWLPVQEIPEGYVLKRYGLDFGWNDPNAIVAVYENDDGVIVLDEKLYQSKLPTPDLIDFCKKLEPELFVCDSARPEIINDLVNAGVRAIGVDKSPVGKQNSIMYGIDLIKRRKVFYTANSQNLEREYLTYAWRKKKSTGETLDEPEDANNHLMDSARYALLDMERKPIEYAGVR
jgi:phage terminase large subunit